VRALGTCDILFADFGTGRARGLVSQGRVNALIQAKPQQRRHLLEKRGPSPGFISRRHEAELTAQGRRNQPSTAGRTSSPTLDVQLQGLKKQARQATRYAI